MTMDLTTEDLEEEPLTFGEIKKLMWKNGITRYNGLRLDTPNKESECHKLLENSDVGTSVSRRPVSPNGVVEKSTADLPLPAISMMSHTDFWKEQLEAPVKNPDKPIVVVCWCPVLLVGNRLGFLGMLTDKRMIKICDVQERLSANKVVDNNKLLYVLYGPMHMRHNVPEQVRVKFNAGVPVDWRMLCSRWGAYLELACPPSFDWTSENFFENIGFVEKQATTIQKNCICSCDVPNSASNLPKHIKKSQAKLQNTTIAKDLTMVELENWSILLNDKDKELICVTGSTPHKKKKVSSAPITKRISNTELQDKNGTCYRLLGTLNDTKGQLSPTIRNFFANGISRNWKNILHTQKKTKEVDTDAKEQLNVTVSRRSGRKVIPTLKFWTGERVVTRSNRTLIERDAASTLDITTMPTNQSERELQVRLVPLRKDCLALHSEADQAILKKYWAIKKQPRKRHKPPSMGVDFLRRIHSLLPPEPVSLSLPAVTFTPVRTPLTATPILPTVTPIQPTAAPISPTIAPTAAPTLLPAKKKKLFSMDNLDYSVQFPNTLANYTVRFSTQAPKSITMDSEVSNLTFTSR